MIQKVVLPSELLRSAPVAFKIPVGLPASGPMRVHVALDPTYEYTLLIHSFAVDVIASDFRAPGFLGAELGRPPQDLLRGALSTVVPVSFFTLVRLPRADGFRAVLEYNPTKFSEDEGLAGIGSPDSAAVPRSTSPSGNRFMLDPAHFYAFIISKLSLDIITLSSLAGRLRPLSAGLSPSDTDAYKIYLGIPVPMPTATATGRRLVFSLLHDSDVDSFDSVVSYSCFVSLVCKKWLHYFFVSSALVPSAITAVHELPPPSSQDSSTVPNLTRPCVSHISRKLQLLPTTVSPNVGLL